jgi:hypothetical protein
MMRTTEEITTLCVARGLESKRRSVKQRVTDKTKKQKTKKEYTRVKNTQQKWQKRKKRKVITMVCGKEPGGVREEV